MTAVNWRLSAPEMRQLIEHSTATFAFVEADSYKAVTEATAGLASELSVVVVGARGSGSYEAWLQAFSPVDEQEASGAPDDIAMQMYTSGTNATPKGVLFSHAALHAIEVGADAMGIRQDAVVLVVIPMFHAGGAGVAIMALSRGAHLVISSDTRPAALAETIEAHQVSALALVPTILAGLVAHIAAINGHLPSLRVLSYLGSPMPRGVLEACLERLDCGLAQFYGLTEVQGATVLSPDDHTDTQNQERLNSVGRPLPGVEVRIVNPFDGSDLPPGGTGEIWVRSPTVMNGYFGADDLTRETVTSDGFVRTGDGGYLHDGYLYLRDRVKDMIVTGGENVYPAEVERVLAECPGVREVAVVGAPSSTWGETVQACVVPTDPASGVSADELVSFARQRLAGFKCPTAVVFVDELPRNASGKILKRELRDERWIRRHLVTEAP
jgi:long-chain acyl-CoA synthetase